MKGTEGSVHVRAGVVVIDGAAGAPTRIAQVLRWVASIDCERLTMNQAPCGGGRDTLVCVPCAAAGLLGDGAERARQMRVDYEDIQRAASGVRENRAAIKRRPSRKGRR